MLKKKKINEIVNEVEETVETHLEQLEVIAEPAVLTNIPLTHHALSVVKNDDQTYSVIQIKFNPKEKLVSPVIETLETNTDLFIIQERISVLLFDIHNSIME